MLLGQIGDIFAVILIMVGGLSPLVALVTSALSKERRPARRYWYLVAGYYVFLGALILAMFWWSRAVAWPREQPVPLMCIFGVAAVLGGPILALVLVSRMSALWRHPEGHCQECGYDLTGNVSGRCPECGTNVESRGKSA